MLWPFCARSTMRETLEWRTNVMAAINGEQRIRLRTIPRRRLEMTYGLDDRRLEYASNLARAELPGPFDVPLWHEWQQLTAGVVPTDTTVSVDTSAASFIEGGKALLWNDWDDAEVADIDTVGFGSLTFTSGITGTYPAGARCMPVVPGYAREGLTVSRTVDSFRDGQITWEVAEGFITGDLSDSILASYQGEPLFNECVRLASGSFEDRTSRDVFVIDNGVAAPVYDTARDFAERTATLAWVTKGAADLWALRAQLEAIAGRWLAFWVPVSNRGIQLTATSTAGAGSLTIRDAGLHLTASSGDLFFRRNDDTTIAVRYTSSIASSGNETLTLSAPLAENLVPSTLKTSCQLLRARMASDAITIDHESPRIASVIAACIELP